jgi:exonuclease-1
MGIENLLTFLYDLSIIKSDHIRSYSGKRVAIDGYCWLHQSVYTDNCSMAFNEKPLSYIKYMINKTKLLIKYNITPIFIFDGNKIPYKLSEESSREYNRNKKIEQAYKLKEQGDIKSAKLKYVQSIDITPEMTYQFCLELDKLKIEYIIAPYEADAQLAYLDKINYVDTICTEDSDLIAYGCKNIIYKLQFNGQCDSYYQFNLYNHPKFANFNPNNLLQFCILSGCDYFKVNGIGIKKSYLIINTFNTIINADQSTYDHLYTKYNYTNNNHQDFITTFLLFNYHIVYCPKINDQRYLYDISIPYYLTPYITENVVGIKQTNQEISQLISKCYINPITLLPF